MKENKWLRLLAYVTGLVNQELLAQNEYLAAENRILRAHLVESKYSCGISVILQQATEPLTAAYSGAWLVLTPLGQNIRPQ